MTQSVTDNYVKFGTYMKESKYSKKFVEGYLTGEDLDKTFEKFAKENAVDFTLEDIKMLHEIIIMLKNPTLRDFIMEYAKTHKPKIVDVVPPPTTKVVSPVDLPTDLIDASASGTFKEFVACNGLKYYEHIPSRLVVKQNVAIGFRSGSSNVINPLNPEKVQLAAVFGFRVIKELPAINRMGNLKAGLIKEYVDLFDDRIRHNLSVHKIYRIEGTGAAIRDETASKSDQENIYIAGSKALTTFRDQLYKNSFEGELKKAFGQSVNLTRIKQFNEFKATDTDLFILNSEVENRMALLDVDVVKSKSKSIEKLLECSFDLPPCQIAIDYKGDFIMTAHCLYSIITVNYYMPPEFSYMPMASDVPVSTIRFVKSHVKPEDLPLTLRSNYDTIIKNKLRKIRSRMKKYEKRGFYVLGYGMVDADVTSILRLDYYVNNFYH